MLTQERHNEIIRLLDERGSVKTSALCDLLATSRETVRRDLETLERKKKLQRIHGGAMKLENGNENSLYTSFHQRETKYMQAKAAIAQEAVKYISPGQAIALDCGTTGLALAKEIKRSFHHPLTVVTNSLAVANELTDTEGITLVVTGGVYSAEERGFPSDLATLILSRINIDVFFLTICGITLDRGITYQRMTDLAIQAKLMEVSDKTVVIADSSKLGVNSLARMCGVEDIDMIITDSSAPAAAVQAFEQAGIKVVISKNRKEDSHHAKQ